MATGIQKLLFIDTNIWLDFYRASSDALLELLEKVEAMQDRLIVTHQLEMEFKANRQKVILQAHKLLGDSAPKQIPAIGVLVDASTFKKVNKTLQSAKARVGRLQAKLLAFIEKPTTSDPVFKTCQRIFHKNDALTLTRLDVDDELRQEIRGRALRRLQHGCPPRKPGDYTFGDAINWEWMVQCAIDERAELVIVSRDTDYGATHSKESYVNDHLRHEFSERVSKKRKLLLYSKLSDALKHFDVQLSEASVAAESAMLALPEPELLPNADLFGDAATDEPVQVALKRARRQFNG